MFEIDLRLRTFGESGLLTPTFETFRGHYAADGQAQQFEQAGDCWERTGLLEFKAEPEPTDPGIIGASVDHVAETR